MMMHPFRSLLQCILCCGILFPASLYAQEEKKPVRDTINTDRLDQTQSPHIVPRGKLQVEAGFSVNPFDSSGGTTPLIGIAVLRYGISDRLELNLLAEDGRDRDRYIEETTQGVYPLAIGGKVLLLEREQGIVPQIALVALVKLPFTSRTADQSPYWSPQILLAFENKISDKLELEYNIGAKQNAYDTEWGEMGSISLQIELSKRLNIFVEYFGNYQHSEDPLHNADVGLAFLMSPSLQFDLAAGRSISAPEDKQNSFGSVGFSFRLPD